MVIMKKVTEIDLTLDGGYNIIVRADNEEFEAFEEAMYATSKIGGGNTFHTPGLITMHCGDCSADNWDSVTSKITVNCKKVMMYRINHRIELQ